MRMSIQVRSLSCLTFVALLPWAAACSSGTAAQNRERPSAGTDGDSEETNYVHPVIAEFGRAVALPEGAFQPDRSITYQVVFDITTGAPSASEVNPGLDKVARFLNVFATAGVEPQTMELVAVLHGDATEAALSDEAYRRKESRANPNTPLIAALERAGVEVYVCGQALAHQNIPHADVAEPVEIALAALTLTATLAQRDYTVQRF